MVSSAALDRPSRGMIDAGDRQDEARRHRGERLARRRGRRGRAGRRARFRACRLCRVGRRSPGAARPRTTFLTSPAERAPDPAHRGELRGVDRRASTWKQRTRSSRCSVSRPASELPRARPPSWWRHGPLPEHRDGQRRLPVGRRRAARRGRLPARDRARGDGGFRHVYVFGTAGEGYAVDTPRFRRVIEVFGDEMAGHRCAADGRRHRPVDGERRRASRDRPRDGLPRVPDLAPDLAGRSPTRRS